MKTPQLPTFRNPNEIIHNALVEAIAPLKKELAEAVAEDQRLYDEKQIVHPDLALKEWNDLLAQAKAGDKDAMKKIADSGGKEAFVSRICGSYPVREEVRYAAAIRTADLLEILIPRIQSQIGSAREAINAQWNELLSFHGEPAGLSKWDNDCQHILSNLLSLVRNAKNGVGIGYQLGGLGLLDYLK